MTLKLNGSSGSVSLDAPTNTTSGADITFKFPVADGAAGQVLTTNGSGQLEWKYPSLGFADQWRVTSDFSSADTIITSNWERVDSRGSSGPVGTGMSESSGVFTFPVTGHWLVTFMTFCAGTSADWTDAFILATTNNSAYNYVARTRDSCEDGDSHTSLCCQALMDVTSTTNVKVKFKVAAAASIAWYGDTDQSETSAVFLRLGDT